MKMSENMYTKLYMDNNVPYNNEKYIQNYVLMKCQMYMYIQYPHGVGTYY